MMLTPCGPSAVPMGGAGLALPAGICRRTTALTRFAMLFQTPQNTFVCWLDFLYLEKIENHWCLATEKRDEHGNFVAVHIDIADRANKFGEWAVNDTHALAFRETNFGLGLIRFFSYLFQNRFDFVLVERNRTSAGTDKACDAGGIAYNIPGFIA